MSEYNAEWPAFTDYCKRLLEDKKANGVFPPFGRVGGLEPSMLETLDACLRAIVYTSEHNGELPPRVWIRTKGTSTPTPTTPNKPPTEKSSFHQAVEKAVGTYTTFTEYYNQIKKKTWEGYYNDLYSLSDEIKRLTNNQSLNCTDHSQLGMAVAKDLWYDARYCRVTCKSGGHIILQVKGYELGNNWVNVDLAAAASSDYPIGSYWCSSYAKPVVIDEAWINSDDGRT